MNHKVVLLLILIFILAALTYLFRDALFFQPDRWETEIPGIGSSSSPRAIDLNGDGIKDIVMGGGAAEFESTDFGVIAIDGMSGETIWNVPARNQVIGSPVFIELTGDQTPDVIIGGRSAVLYAINGATGELIWEYLSSYEGMDIVYDREILNFYSPQLIPDQDGDGIRDILNAYGGYIAAPPSETDRPVGSLMIISSADGSRIARAMMPDDKETYMSPIVYDFDQDGELTVLYGTGGETIDGNLYASSLLDVLNEDLTDADTLAEGFGKGFIAPPILTDLTEDGIMDITVNSVNGKIHAINGADFSTIWTADLGDEFEGYTTPSPGRYNHDDITDFFVSYGHGVWPTIDFAYHVLLDGRDGTVISADTAGTFQYASPVSIDYDEDDLDEALVVINRKDQQQTGMTQLEIFVNEMLILDPLSNDSTIIHETKAGSNLGSTPLLTDLDGDGYLDVIYSYMNDPINFYSFESLRIERIETSIRLNKEVRWGEYMGPGYDGVYEK